MQKKTAGKPVNKKPVTDLSTLSKALATSLQLLKKSNEQLRELERQVIEYKEPLIQGGFYGRACSRLLNKNREQLKENERLKAEVKRWYFEAADKNGAELEESWLSYQAEFNL